LPPALNPMVIVMVLPAKDTSSWAAAALLVAGSTRPTRMMEHMLKMIEGRLIMNLGDIVPNALRGKPLVDP
jgi:hypothetical protein